MNKYPISEMKILKKQRHKFGSTIPDFDREVEKSLLCFLSSSSLILPINSKQLCEKIEKILQKPVFLEQINVVLQKHQNFIRLIQVSIDMEISGFEVIQVESDKIQKLYNDLSIEHSALLPKSESCIKQEEDSKEGLKRKLDADIKSEDETLKRLNAGPDNVSEEIRDLLSMPSTLEKQSKQVGAEILELLQKPTAKERFLAEKFKSHGVMVMEFCPHGTRAECRISSANAESDSNDEKPGEGKSRDHCQKLHFKKIIQSHTDENLGDCSFLNTCFHMDSCKYVHYEVDSVPSSSNSNTAGNAVVVKNDTEQKIPTLKRTIDPAATLYPPQWIQCDLRYLDMTVLGKFAVVMADPPWDIHMELPYGTMSDDEMRRLGVPALQDDGLIFLWVTGRAMELGRECLKLWGYERVDELIWVKTNQLQRIIRTGRTGHWLNHGKEHCLVGMKGNPKNLNRGLDCDVIVAEVRATSHKPDEIYGIIERLSPGTRKIELFGRPHNVQPNWITLGNQLDGIRLVDRELVSQFEKRYPDGNCMMAPTNAAGSKPLG